MRAMLIIFLFLLFNGCVSVKPRELLSKIYNVPENEIFISTNDVIKRIDSKPFEMNISSKIEISDPILLYGDSAKYRSNFQLYHFQALENQKYNIRVASKITNPGGLVINQFAMAPLVYILDANGNIIDCSPKKINVDEFFYVIVFTFEGLIKRTDKYFILIGSDNRFSGITFLKYMHQYYSQYSFGSIPWSINGYPIGRFKLDIVLK
jgi:hypothetical protein